MGTSSTSETTDLRRPAAPAGSPPPAVWATTIAAGVGATTLVNLLLLALGHGVDAELAYLDGDTTGTITAGGVAFMSIVPLAVGTALAALLARRWGWMLRLAQVIGALAAIATVPWVLETDVATRMVLGAMHLVVGVAVVAILEVGHRRR